MCFGMLWAGLQPEPGNTASTFMQAVMPLTGYQPMLRGMARPMQVQRPIYPVRNVRAFDASPKVTEILEQIKTLSLLEASELVKEMEETFGIDASAGGGMMMMAPGAGVP